MTNPSLSRCHGIANTGADFIPAIALKDQTNALKPDADATL